MTEAAFPISSYPAQTLSTARRLRRLAGACQRHTKPRKENFGRLLGFITYFCNNRPIHWVAKCCSRQSQALSTAT